MCRLPLRHNLQRSALGLRYHSAAPLHSRHFSRKSKAQLSSDRTHRVLYPPNRSSFKFDIEPHRIQASYTSYALLVILACGSAVVVDYVARGKAYGEKSLKQTPPVEVEVETLTSEEDSRTPSFSEMAVPSGFLGNLTAEQETKLRELWELTFKTFGVADPIAPNGAPSASAATPSETPTASDAEGTKTKEKRGLFHRRHKEGSSAGLTTPTGSPGRASNDPEDKYGQTRELQEILATQSPESLRSAFWSMVKRDHPDALLLRFLRARKWDVQRALAMMISTMHWRSKEMHVDDDIMKTGEGGALEDSKSSDATVKREGHDFLEQLRLGKSFLHGVDKEGRPLCFVRVRLHRGGEQTERALERYTVYVIETARLILQPPVETATIVFDMTSFSMANMDYTPVKFMIKIFEANYPESLGAVLVHKAPWIFQGIWKIIRGWLDPIVAGKVHFTNNVEELQEFVPKNQIIKELGGDENWQYKYVEPTPGENDLMKDEATRDQINEERRKDVLDYEKKTFEWIHGTDTKKERDELAQKFKDNYWRLDPYIRARTLYDRTGMIQKDGKINFYPTQTLKKDNVNGQVAIPPAPEATADDVD